MRRSSPGKPYSRPEAVTRRFRSRSVSTGSISHDLRSVTPALSEERRRLHENNFAFRQRPAPRNANAFLRGRRGLCGRPSRRDTLREELGRISPLLAEVRRAVHRSRRKVWRAKGRKGKAISRRRSERPNGQDSCATEPRRTPQAVVALGGERLNVFTGVANKHLHAHHSSPIGASVIREQRLDCGTVQPLQAFTLNLFRIVGRGEFSPKIHAKPHPLTRRFKPAP